jgi:replication initiation and membrane attachment protein
MQYLSISDFVSVRRASMIGDYDRRLLAELYQPLIGHQGVALFITLDAFHDALGGDEALLVEVYVNHTQMTITDLSIAKARLEAVGLLKTYTKKQADYQIHALELFAPKSPAAFFEDVVLTGLLTEYIGAPMVQKWRLRYGKAAPLTGFTENSASFGEMFHPDFSSPSFSGFAKNETLGRVSAAIESRFDRRAFIDELSKKSQLNMNLFTEAIVDEIDRIANLYGIDELAMAEITLACLVANGAQLLDFEKLRQMAALETKFAFSKTRKRSISKITSTTNKAKKIQLMEENEPKTYFRYRNLNNAPAPADLKLINDIQERYALAYPVINALIDFVLEKTDLKFPRDYVEKVAATLVRAQVTSAIDAMEFLNRATRRKKTAGPTTPDNVPKQEVDKQAGGDEELDIAAMFKELQDHRKGT